MSTTSYSSQNTKFCLETERVSLLLKKAGSPDKDFCIIHVCGTNGKGSVCSFLETGLISMGINCGRFSSPELFSVEDSITVCGNAIKSEELKRITNKLSLLCSDVEKELGKAPSPFEVIFASALVYFREKNCTHVILECGMGGMGDATNSINGAQIAVFTDIAKDHTDYLGDTVEKIARNKCGILRNNIKVFSSEQCLEAKEVIKDECKNKNCTLEFVQEYSVNYNKNLNVSVSTECGDVVLSLAGVHQARNAALAVRVLKNFSIENNQILHTLTHTVNRARLEEIAPSVYFDGAHNPAGVSALVKSINAADINEKMIFVNGFMADKDIESCYALLRKIKNQNFEIYTCTVETNPRSETGENIASFAQNMGYRASSFKNVKEALREARKNAKVIFVFGSLYMYKELFDKNGELQCE